MPGLEDAYADRTAPGRLRVALALALVLAGSAAAALGLAAAAPDALAGVGVPDATAAVLGTTLAGLVVPATLAGLHAVVPASRRLRVAAAGGVGLCALALALHWTVGGVAVTVAYGLGVLAAVWSLVAAATGAAGRVAPASDFAVDPDRPLYDGRSRAGEHVTPADGGTEDDDVTPLLDDE